MANFWQKLTKPIIGLSPMDGITDEPTRQIQILVAKPAVLYTEFLSVEGFVRNPAAFRLRLAFKDNERPIVAQIFGHTPSFFRETSRTLSLMGFDGLDLNYGCPAKSVLEQGGGGDLIGNFDLTQKIIEESLAGIKESGREIPLSVKTRIGKNTINYEWLPFLANFPLAEITVHGRLLTQGHAGPVCWEEIARASAICRQNKIVCLGNGGIKSLAEAREKARQFGLDGVLIGQAALGNPWVFLDDHQTTEEETLKIIYKHAKLVAEFYPPENFVIVRKHFGWYPREFPNYKKLMLALLQANNLKEVKKVIEDFRSIESMGKIN